MKTVNIHEAKTHLSRLLEGVANGESFVIAKSGKPVAKVTPIVEKPIQRIGFMEGQFEVPDDIDTVFAEEIQSMFEDGPLFPDQASKSKK
jgi:prevent-host-death family protein